MIKEYKNTGYFVNSNGDIIGKKKKLKPTITPYGYKSVCLYFDGRAKTFLVHRLVSELFVDNPNNKPDINHIDGNKLNNHYSNLEWCSKGENIKHFWETIYDSKKHKLSNRRFTYDEMVEIYNQFNKGNIYKNELAKKFNVDRMTITRAIKFIEKEKLNEPRRNII